jgi:hypothetical protein
MLYCIEVTRELEEKAVIHHNFETAPTRSDVLKVIEDEGYNYDDNYGKLTFYEVTI